MSKRAPNAKLATLLLGFSIFFTGASGLVGEYILSTLSSYLLGNSIEQFSITIALMLGMMGIGGWVQKYIDDTYLLEKFILIEMLLALLVGFAPLAIYAAFGFLETHFLLVQYAFILSIGFLIGFEIPFIIRINQAYSSTLKANLSTVISADYFGSLAGALIWVYWMLPNFSIVINGFLLASLNFLIATVTVLYFNYHHLIEKRVTSFIVIGITISALTGGALSANHWHLELQQRLYNDKIVFAKTTRYQHLVVTHNGKRDEYRFYINGNLQFSSLDEYRYHEQLVHPIMHIAPSHKNILVLGGGDGMAVRELLKYPDISSITLVDLDHELVQLAKNSEVFKKLNHNAFTNAIIRFPNMDNTLSVIGKREWVPYGDDLNRSGERDAKPMMFDVIHIDADKFLDRIANQNYDVVIIDLPDPTSIDLNKLYSSEFYMKLKRLLSSHAIIVIQSTSPFQTQKAFLCIGDTLQNAGFQTIPYHDNIPTFGEWGWYIAWKQGTFSKETVLKQTEEASSYTVPTRYITPKYFLSSTVFPKDFQNHTSPIVNTLMDPKLFLLYNQEAAYYE